MTLRHDDDRIFEAMVSLNGEMRRMHYRAIVAVGVVGVLIASIAAAIMTLISCMLGMWVKPSALVAALAFVATMVVVLLAGRVLCRSILNARQSRAIGKLARDLGVTEAALLQWTVPEGDSSKGNRKLRLSWSTPQTRSPLRWP